MKTIVGAVALLLAQPAAAQDSFSGVHLGAGVTAVDHHFVVSESSGPGTSSNINVGRWGVGGQLFAGYDFAVAPKVIVGVESSLDIGGQEAIRRTALYTVATAPRHGYALTARVGIVPVSSVLLYAGAGYGGHDYRVTITDPSVRGDDLSYNRSFVLRGGAEYRLLPHIAVRAEFEHLDATRNTFILGVPIRF